MASYAHLVARERCPGCSAEIAGLTMDLIGFQWGYCPSRQPWNDLFYRVGDAIRWRLDDKGRIPPWVYFVGALQGGNVGDPSARDLLVRALDLNGYGLTCAACGMSDIAISIRGGHIVGLEPGLADCDIAVVGPDGQMHPRPDWDHHPMPEIPKVRSRTLATGEGLVIAGKRAP
ncbi:hypothetical protein [Polyangium aurulentum]|uniref:hypothetical protein n=1 Tax=Polyangium aurulentum TaxID=2567896 RepID=UPI0010ADFE65|nr:hypothetical protein [Polyangium aurulentum]UQA56973.1 hypothetical protein E8A73_037630 [Polyangium aurulentum]